jgi:uncharacterized protein HemX
MPPPDVCCDDQVEKQREQLRAELSKMNQLLGGNEKIIKQQDVEVQRLTTMLKRMDEEALNQRKEYDQVRPAPPRPAHSAGWLADWSSYLCCAVLCSAARLGR